MVDRLNIVNHMLFTVGEQVQNTLQTQHPSVIQALQVLESVDGDFQGRGWWFNTENSITLSQDDTGKVIIPSGTMSLQVVSSYANSPSPDTDNRARYTVRGNKVYDSFEHTFVLNTDLVVNVVIQQPIEDLPHKAAMYLKHKSAEAMYAADDGDRQKLDTLSTRVMEAWHNLKAEELRLSNVNALNSPVAAQLRHRIGQYSGNSINGGTR